MLKSIFCAIVIFLMVSLSACVGIHVAVPEKPLPKKSDNTSSMEQEQNKNTTELQIQVGDQVFTAAVRPQIMQKQSLYLHTVRKTHGKNIICA